MRTQIAQILAEAAGKGFAALFASRSEQFYYCTYILSEDGAPFISASSVEGIERMMREKGIPMSDYPEYKWSYADSPYCAYGYEEYFGAVRELFAQRFPEDLSDEAYAEELALWLDAMELAMHRLDENGLFGDAQRNMFINVEIMPPENSNDQRAERLNPEAVFRNWYAETSSDEKAEDKSRFYYEAWHPQLCTVTLTEPVTDKKTIFLIRKMLGGSVAEWLETCRIAPKILAKDVQYRMAEEYLLEHPDLRQILKLEKQKDYWHS